MVTRPRAKVYARRRQRRMAGVEHDLTEAQWAALREAWGGCAYCGTPAESLQKDCVLPISRGGRYTLANVVPACRSCNASKCNSEATSWMRRKKLDEAQFLIRQLAIHQAILRDSASRADQPSRQCRCHGDDADQGDRGHQGGHHLLGDSVEGQ